jgi:hypothetical protein
VARPVHGSPAVLLSLLLSLPVAGCVVPPPLEVESGDAGANAPPIILEARDQASNPLRPPATLTVNRAVPGELRLTLYDIDLEDELFVQLFVDYDPADPRDADVNCGAPPPAAGTVDPERRSATCTTAGLCPASLGTGRRLELEVYDAAPEPNSPFRTPGPGGLSSTWTLELACVEEAP